MKIWVDADACPKAARDHLVRVAERRRVPVLLVANRALAAPHSELVSTIRVGRAFDAADRYIAEHLAAGDLVITADVPLAADAVARGALALSARGELFDPENIGIKVAVRELMTELRATGDPLGGPPPFGAADRRKFADALDRLLTRLAVKS